MIIHVTIIKPEIKGSMVNGILYSVNKKNKFNIKIFISIFEKK